MKNLSKQKQIPKAPLAGKQYSYTEIVEFLDTRWDDSFKEASLTKIKKLDAAFGSPSKTLHTVLIAGTNGKSLTAHYAAEILKEEGLKVGAFCSPHMLTYNERFTLQNELISNKAFTDIANEVLTAVSTLEIDVHALDVLTMIAFLYFSRSNIDVALCELSEVSEFDPIMICKPKITAITRFTNFEQNDKGLALLDKTIKTTLSVATPQTFVISADQSKHNLLRIQQYAEEKGAIWAMPIRKLAPLAYPFEQLHGRSAALAERIAHIYINNFLSPETVIISSSLLVKQKGQRGRPTLEAKRKSELHPRKTIEQFWKDHTTSLTGRFQILEKEKPTILLDTASNLDSFQNVLLGIRLLHYRRPLKGLTIILGNNNPDLDLAEFLKQLRYFFKKTSGNIITCPTTPIPGQSNAPSWDPEKVSNDIKSMKIKARSAYTFKEAFNAAVKTVDERHGLIVIAGSPSLITEYWRLKGMKKL